MMANKNGDMMRKMFLILVILFVAGPSFADTWCQWTGTEGTDCRSDSKGYLRYNGKVIGGNETNYNSHGFYELVTTQPTMTADQVRDAEIWGFADNQISRTWTVRDLTTEEIQNRDDQNAVNNVLSRELFYVLKWFKDAGIITSTHLNNAPIAIKKAYQARERLEAPN